MLQEPILTEEMITASRFGVVSGGPGPLYMHGIGLVKPATDVDDIRITLLARWERAKLAKNCLLDINRAQSTAKADANLDECYTAAQKENERRKETESWIVVRCDGEIETRAYHRHSQHEAEALRQVLEDETGHEWRVFKRS